MMFSSSIIVEPLAHHPQHVDGLVNLLHMEWGHLDNWTNPLKLRQTIETRLQIDAAPLALVALEGDRLAGSISIKRHELLHHQDKEFWIGDVIVAADQRGRGIGTLMIHAMTSRAAALSIADLYLYTPDQEAYYRKLGWRTIGQDPANGEDNVIMHYAV
ncbi:GNAT family N-acetyltransferase [Rhizobium sp. Leaf262]|uniref:GNAT family N-acetyltransferase n=1 Tax=Rhizobium sp. Leaf262 TaxID=1736312 RepID=UPI000714E094|nr:GNAT family N-acetyltransferase [Rhizobium sp. Leaf262]KQO77552.1 hypothetical protein ASF29_05695 [Rhizobium sp. Leaf262]